MPTSAVRNLQFMLIAHLQLAFCIADQCGAEFAIYANCTFAACICNADQCGAEFAILSCLQFWQNAVFYTAYILLLKFLQHCKLNSNSM